MVDLSLDWPPALECTGIEPDGPIVSGVFPTFGGFSSRLVSCFSRPAMVLPLSIWNKASGDPRQKSSSQSNSKG